MISKCVNADLADREMFMVQRGHGSDRAKRVRDRLSQAVCPIASIRTQII